MLFDLLTNYAHKYDASGLSSGSMTSNHSGYSFPPYGDGFRISQNTKYSAILFRTGVCKSYSMTFEDICLRLGIPCKVITGRTSMEHVWNVVYDLMIHKNFI